MTAGGINSKWIGQGEKKMRALFDAAREVKPWVIFFDEVECLLPRTDKDTTSISFCF